MKYKHFGILIDCSCNAVMKVSQVKHLIDVMEKMGYDLLELCTDDTYKIEDEPYFGYLRGGYSKAEIQEMDAYAKAHGVSVAERVSGRKRGRRAGSAGAIGRSDGRQRLFPVHRLLLYLYVRELSV